MRNIILFVLAVLLASCTKTIYVPVESVRTEYKDKYLRDSIYQYDSVYFAVKGDTVWLERYKVLYRDRIFRDSLYINDTIRIPYPVKGDTVFVNKTTWYQDVLIWIGMGAIAVLMIWLIKRKI